LPRNIEPIRSLLLPADIDEVLEHYEDILKSYQNLQERNTIYGSFKRTNQNLDVLFPLKEHPVHGITGLHAIEKYDKNMYVRRYHYQWKRIIPKEGIMFSHISAWENEAHDNPNTPEAYLTATEPHHHHHVPGERIHRKANYNIRTLEASFKFIAYYIRSGKEYKP